MEDWKTALGVPAMDCLKFVTVESRLNGEFSFLSYTVFRKAAILTKDGWKTYLLVLQM